MNMGRDSSRQEMNRNDPQADDLTSDERERHASETGTNDEIPRHVTDTGGTHVLGWWRLERA